MEIIKSARRGGGEGKYGEGERKVISIKADIFDSFLSENTDIDTKKIQLIWMDIEGHEGRFLKGASSF